MAKKNLYIIGYAPPLRLNPHQLHEHVDRSFNAGVIAIWAKNKKNAINMVRNKSEGVYWVVKPEAFKIVGAQKQLQKFGPNG